jgi:hypothetical protein
MSLILWSVLAYLAACSIAAVVALAVEHRQRRAEAIRRAIYRHPCNQERRP